MQIFFWQHDETGRTCWAKTSSGPRWNRVGFPELCLLNDARQLERELASIQAQLAERDAELAALKGHAVEPRIGLNSDGSLDEVVGSPGHIEQLDSGHWFVEIGEYAIWLHANGKIVSHYEHRAAYPKEADA